MSCWCWCFSGCWCWCCDVFSVECSVLTWSNNMTLKIDIYGMMRQQNNTCTCTQRTCQWVSHEHLHLHLHLLECNSCFNIAHEYNTQHTHELEDGTRANEQEQEHFAWTWTHESRVVCGARCVVCCCTDQCHNHMWMFYFITPMTNTPTSYITYTQQYYQLCCLVTRYVICDAVDAALLLLLLLSLCCGCLICCCCCDGVMFYCVDMLARFELNWELSWVAVEWLGVWCVCGDVFQCDVLHVVWIMCVPI